MKVGGKEKKAKGEQMKGEKSDLQDDIQRDVFPGDSDLHLVQLVLGVVQRVVHGLLVDL